MSGQRRALVCAALALAVPLPAFALGSGNDDVAPEALSVTAALDSCGLAGAQIVCMLDVSFNQIPHATRHTAAVTRPDGSVIDYGAIAAGATTLHVPYVGDGSYGVRVSAYGRPGGDEEERPVLLDTDVSSAKPVKPQPGGPGEAEQTGAAKAPAKEAAAPAGEPAAAAPADAVEPASAEDCAALEPAPLPPASEPPAEPLVGDPAPEDEPAADPHEDGRAEDEDQTAPDPQPPATPAEVPAPPVESPAAKPGACPAP